MHFITKLMHPKQKDVEPLPPLFFILVFFLSSVLLFLIARRLLYDREFQPPGLKFLLSRLFNQLLRFICTTRGATASVNMELVWFDEKLLCVFLTHTHIFTGHLCHTKSTTSWTLNASAAFQAGFRTPSQDGNDQIGCALPLMTSRERLEDNNTSRTSQLFIMRPPSHRLWGKSRCPVWPPEGSLWRWTYSDRAKQSFVFSLFSKVCFLSAVKCTK